MCVLHRTALLRSDNSINRDAAQFSMLFQLGGFEVVDTEEQQDFDKDLARVRMWALYPAAWWKGGKGPAISAAAQEWKQGMVAL